MKGAIYAVTFSNCAIITCLHILVSYVGKIHVCAESFAREGCVCKLNCNGMSLCYMYLE